MLRTLSVVVTFTIAGLVGPTAADAADAYPDPTVAVAVDPDACAGSPLPASARSTVPGTWTVTYSGQTRSGSGETVAVRFSTAGIPAEESRGVTFRLDYDGGQVTRVAPVSLADCDALAPEDAATSEEPDGNGLLPSTGGLPLLLLCLGLALVVVGGAVVARRASEK